MSYNTAIDRTTLITSIAYDLGKARKERIPMKIAVAAANGKASGKIIAEALKRGHEVVAFGRHEQNDTGASTYIRKDIMDLTKEDVKGFDDLVDGFGAWAPETLPLHTTTLLHLADVVSGTDTRLLVGGGAGSLYINRDHTTALYEAPDFQADGERTGSYEIHGEEFAPNSKGESIISYADYAIAMVDEIEKGDHLGQRISVVRK